MATPGPVDEEPVVPSRAIGARSGPPLLWCLLIMAAAAVITGCLPRRRLEIATMDVCANDRAFSAQILSGATSFNYPRFVAAEMQQLKGSEILNPVIDRLDLVNFYSGNGRHLDRHEVLHTLVSSLRLREIDDTGLIEVGVYGSDWLKAADIANTVALVYAEKRESELLKWQEPGIAVLEREVEHLREGADELAKEAARLREREGIEDADLGVEVSTRRARVSHLRGLVARIDVATPEEVQGVIQRSEFETVWFLEGIGDLRAAQADMARLLKSGLDPRDPRIWALNEKMRTLQSLLAEPLSRIKGEEEGKLKAEESALSECEQRLVEHESNPRNRERLLGPYVDAETKYLESKETLQTTEALLASARVGSHQAEPVKIWECSKAPGESSPPWFVQYCIVVAAIGGIVRLGLARSRLSPASRRSRSKSQSTESQRPTRARRAYFRLVLLLGIGISGAAVVLYCRSKSPRATVIMEVKKDLSTFGEPYSLERNKQFVLGEIAMIRGRKFLGASFERLDFARIFPLNGSQLSKDAVLTKLVASLDLREIRDTDLVAICAHGADRFEAANIANSIAGAYRDKRIRDLQKSWEPHLTLFQNDVTSQRKIVEAAKEEAERIRERDGIIDPDPENAIAIPIASSGSAIDAGAAIRETKFRIGRLQGMIARGDPVEPEEVPRFPPTVFLEIQAARRTRLKQEETNLATFEQQLAKRTRYAYLARPYYDAKAKYLEAKRMLIAAEMRMLMAKPVDSDGVKIREWAMASE